MKLDKAHICSKNGIFNIIGSRWNLALIWHLRTGVLRFTEIQARSCEANPKTITKHLRDLEHYAIINRKVFAEVPPRVEYSLTERGRALLPIIDAIVEWGGTYLPAEKECAAPLPESGEINF